MPAAPGAPPRIVTWGGHDFTRGIADQAIRDFMLSLLEGPSPRICLLPTASGDPAEQAARFHAAFADRGCETSDLSLFRLGRRPIAVREHLLAQDLIYVGGGSLLNLLAVWEAHGLAAILRQAWRTGTVIAGQSAGAMCWMEAAITTASGQPAATSGLGLLPGSLCVHYREEPGRRPAYKAAIAGGMPAGYGLDDHAGLLWEGREVALALSARPGAGVHRVAPGGEHPVETWGLEPLESAAMADDIEEFRRVTRLGLGAGRLA
jgi:dipeptidase E